MLKIRAVPPSFYHDYMRFRQSMNKNYIPVVYIRLTKEGSYHYQIFLSRFGLAFFDIRYFPLLGWCITRKGGGEYFEDFEDLYIRLTQEVLKNKSLYTSHHGCTVHIALCVFGKRGPKMFNFELLFLHGFSSKNREILHKAVLTSQELEDYFFGKKLRKKLGKNQKNLLGVFVQVKIGLKKILSQKEFFFRKRTFCTNTPK